VGGGLPLLSRLTFDFNPINLRNPNSESIATYRELLRDPSVNVNAIELLAPTIEAAEGVSSRLQILPQVARVLTLSTFVPQDQPEKSSILRKAAGTFSETLSPTILPAPTDNENVEALHEASSQLLDAAAEQSAGTTASRHLAESLERLSTGSEALRTAAAEVFLQPLRIDLARLSAVLDAQPMTLQTLPPDLVQEWRAADGRVRVSIAPAGDQGDNAAMREFAVSVLNSEPGAIEGPVSILKASETIIHAFIEAGVLALLTIALLLWIVLRRVGDVLLTLIPLLLAGVVTLEMCVGVGLPLNYANIIAFPLLLGVGVAFKIYYIMAWRAGETHLLQTSLTRAVTFSALTTATAFGSLCFSSHPGTSSMGKLLALSLTSTLLAAVFFQPILMGPPRAQTKATG